MRLEKAMLKARSLPHRAVQTVAGALLGASPDVIRVHQYRPDLFGGPYGETVQDALRGDSDWTIGERETFAATISRAHGCAFCRGSHDAFAKAALAKEGATYTPESLDAAPTRVQAARALILAIASEAPLEEPIAALRRAGADDGAIEDVIDIAASFTMINRVADALQFEVPDESGFRRMAPIILRMGYRTAMWKPED